MEKRLEAIIEALGFDSLLPAQTNEMIIQTDDPRLFWTAFLYKLQQKQSVALFDPHWPSQWTKVLTPIVLKFSRKNPGYILIPTSGSSGLPKLCLHTFDTLMAAAQGFADSPICHRWPNCVQTLPLHHVGGLMPVLRTATCGGRCEFHSYTSLSSLKLEDDPQSYTLSLVPTQLRRLMADSEAVVFLKSLGAIYLGGSLADSNLLEIARAHKLSISLCYGMTETAAMICAADPIAFASADFSNGVPLPHAQVFISPENRIAISSNSLCKGYLLPDGKIAKLPALKSSSRENSNAFLSGDLGKIFQDGRLSILGRADRMIITGGENVSPEKVEEVARSVVMIKDALCYKESDPDWGEKVCLKVVVDSRHKVSTESLLRAMALHLPRHALPKKIDFVEQISRSQMGKFIHH